MINKRNFSSHSRWCPDNNVQFALLSRSRPHPQLPTGIENIRHGHFMWM
jgi:hypothetical protein